MTTGKTRAAGWVFLGAGWLALLVGCVVHSRHEPMWVDELYSFDLIQDPSLTHMLSALGDGADGWLPLYYFLIRPWATVFSMSELSLRLFSSVTFCVAFTLIWKTLRRGYDFWPAAVSLGLVMGTSHVIRFEDADVRGYGLLFALIALATLVAHRLGEREQPGWKWLAVNVLTQALLVLCHPMGGFYGAALFAAVLAGDLILRRRWRPAVALSYPAGWLALGLWGRQILRQADINRPHSWVSVPDFHDIAPTLYGGSDFYPLFLLFTFLAVWRAVVFCRRTPGREEAPAAPVWSAARCRLLLIAAAFVCLPLALWVLAQIVPSNPLFLSRYLIGVSIAWAIILTQLCTCVLAPLDDSGSRRNVWLQVCLAIFIGLNLGPLITEPGTDKSALTGGSDLAFGHADLPIVCLRSHDFLPREHYSPQAERYYFLLDWEAACAPDNSRHATVEYKVLDGLRRHYSALFHDHIVTAEAFLQAHPVFLVHEVPRISWVALRLKPEEYTVTRLEPDRALDYTRDGVWPMLLVEKKR